MAAGWFSWRTGRMPTSGTVSQFRYTVQQVVDHAFRRATGLSASRLSGEGQIISRETLYTLLSELVSVSWPLWTQLFSLLNVGLGSADVVTPNGTVDIRHAYWRILSPWRGAATLGDGSDGSLLFGGAPNDDVTILGPNPSVTVDFTADRTTDTVGVLWGGASTVTTSLSLMTSQNGTDFTVAKTLPSTTFTGGAWSYFKIDPLITAPYLRIQYSSNGSWVLNQLNFSTNSQDIEMGLVSIDDYYNQPNKQQMGQQPTLCYVERNVQSPTLKIWPTPDPSAFYNGTVSSVMRRYIQDPGAFSDTLEVPQRWYEAVVWRLASRLVDELPDDTTGLSEMPPALRIQEKDRRAKRCEDGAARSETIAWGEERTPGPIKMFPNLSCYTK